MDAVLRGLTQVNLTDEGSLGKVEILQDLDLFYIKQLAHNFQEYDLEQRIALEIKMREGTTKLLAAACGGRSPQGGQPHILEAAKSLLTSNERMAAYMNELQRRRTSTRPVVQKCQPSCARVSISELRMPLMWKDAEHFKNKGDNKKFAVFVVFKMGTEIYDTAMVNPVDRSMTDITFDDIILFNDVTPNFECTVDVYSHALECDPILGNIPRRLKKTIHSSISRTVGRRLASTIKDELSHDDLGPKFELVGSAKLTSSNISDSATTFDLQMDNNENVPDQLPLFGHFCCRVAAQPDCAIQETMTGHARVPESGKAELSYLRLFGWRLEVWESKHQVHSSPHHPLALSIDRNAEVTQTSSTVLQLRNNVGLDRGMLTLSFRTPEECRSWMQRLNQHVADHSRWGKAAEEDMQILTPQAPRHSFVAPKRASRFASLYEEIPIRDVSPGSQRSSTDDLSSHSAFVTSYCTPAPLTRSRAFSMSTRSSFRRWGSVRSNKAFFWTKS